MLAVSLQELDLGRKSRSHWFGGASQFQENMSPLPSHPETKVNPMNESQNLQIKFGPQESFRLCPQNWLHVDSWNLHGSLLNDQAFLCHIPTTATQ